MHPILEKKSGQERNSKVANRMYLHYRVGRMDVRLSN